MLCASPAPLLLRLVQRRDVICTRCTPAIECSTTCHPAIRRYPTCSDSPLPTEQLHLRDQRDATGRRSVSQRPATKTRRALHTIWHAAHVRGCTGLPRTQSSSRADAADRKRLFQAVSARRRTTMPRIRANHVRYIGQVIISLMTPTKLKGSRLA